MTNKQAAQSYISCLENADIKNLLKLFTSEALVHSPIYGTKKATDFFPALQEETTNSQLAIQGIFEEKKSNRIALYFRYIWTLINGKTVEFDVVDIMQFDEESQITELKIIYDTTTARELLKEMRDDSSNC